MTRQLLCFIAMALLHVSRSEITGSFYCYMCPRQECTITALDMPIEVGGDIGTLTCGELDIAVKGGDFNPAQCSMVQQRTRATSNPCKCVDETRSICKAKPVSVTKCDLCQGGSNMVIGDPGKIISSTTFTNGNTCGSLFDLQGMFDFSASQCADAQAAAQSQCQCVPDGTPVKECIPQESKEIGCDPNNPTDVCCIGTCKYRATHGQHVCTLKTEDPIPEGYTIFSPPSSGFNANQAGCLFQGSFGCTADADCCEEGNVCAWATNPITKLIGRVCSGKAGNMGQMQSLASNVGGYGGGRARSLQQKVGRKAGKLRNQK